MTSSNRAVGQGGQPFSDFSLAVSVPQGRVRRAAVGLSVVGGESVHRFCVVIASTMQPQSNEKSRGLSILCSAARARKENTFFGFACALNVPQRILNPVRPSNCHVAWP